MTESEIYAALDEIFRDVFLRDDIALTPELSANVEFGDRDHRTLYIAARTGIYKIRLKTAGIPAGR